MSDLIKLYTVYARHCGHVLQVHPDRALMETAAQLATEHRVFSLRVRVAEPDDFERVLDGLRCERCGAAGMVVPDPTDAHRCHRCEKPDLLGWHTIGCKPGREAYATWQKDLDDRRRAAAIEQYVAEAVPADA